MNTFKPLIDPFIDTKIRCSYYEDPGQPSSGQVLTNITYGLSSFGYDLRLSETDFRIYRHIPGDIVDPHNFNKDHLEQSKLFRDEKTNKKYFILPNHSYSLGVSAERIIMPNNALGICVGKSTYARLGIICNTTPLEPGWEGYLTIELSNSSGADCKIYANEGICQILFFEGEKCDEPYGRGKYQDQPCEVVLPRV